jgi:hypothetical protein
MTVTVMYLDNHHSTKPCTSSPLASNVGPPGASVDAMGGEVDVAEVPDTLEETGVDSEVPDVAEEPDVAIPTKPCT